jgi:hypothetical protein
LDASRGVKSPPTKTTETERDECWYRVIVTAAVASSIPAPIKDNIILYQITGEIWTLYHWDFLKKEMRISLNPPSTSIRLSVHQSTFSFRWLHPINISCGVFHTLQRVAGYKITSLVTHYAIFTKMYWRVSDYAYDARRIHICCHRCDKFLSLYL